MSRKIPLIIDVAGIDFKRTPFIGGPADGARLHVGDVDHYRIHLIPEEKYEEFRTHLLTTGNFLFPLEHVGYTKMVFNIEAASFVLMVYDGMTRTDVIKSLFEKYRGSCDSLFH